MIRIQFRGSSNSVQTLEKNSRRGARVSQTGLTLSKLATRKLIKKKLRTTKRGGKAVLNKVDCNANV